MKHSIFLPDDLEPLLQHHLALRQEQFPGTEPRISAVFADALFAYSAQLMNEHFKQHGMPQRIRDRLQKFVDDMAAKGQRLGI